jgi:hypothetical protein
MAGDSRAEDRAAARQSRSFLHVSGLWIKRLRVHANSQEGNRNEQCGEHIKLYRWRSPHAE